jgi:hypothetical protein
MFCWCCWWQCCSSCDVRRCFDAVSGIDEHCRMLLDPKRVDTVDRRSISSIYEGIHQRPKK